jgi:hypothetical protein
MVVLHGGGCRPRALCLCTSDERSVPVVDDS